MLLFPENHSTDPGFDELQSSFSEPVSLEQNLQKSLEAILSSYDCTVGTIHLLNPSTGLLELRADLNLPPAVRSLTMEIPVGKGMAGLAAERAEPVQVCNLQSDSSGVVQPGAKEVPVAGAIALPMIVDGKVYGVLGISKPCSYQFPPAEIERLLSAASVIAESFLLPGSS